VEFDFTKQYQTCRYSFAESYAAMTELLKTTPDLTAVFCMSDIMAMGAIRAITDLGKKVPDDISVIGFDGIELASYLVPLLTTIKQNAEEISKRSVEILWGCISRGERAVHEKIPFEFIPGESVKDISK
jgi:LacI family transcriptional regulator